MQFLNKSTVDQIKTMPNFTKNGYMKMKMPTQLYQVILEAKQNSIISSEYCDVNWPIYNCVRIKEDGTKGMYF